MALLLKSSVSNIISMALQRSIRTGKCTAVEFNSISGLLISQSNMERKTRGKRGRVRTRGRGGGEAERNRA